MKDRNRKFSMDGVLALVLFGIFALCVLAVLLLGARSYRQLTLCGQDAYNQRTAAQYIVTRVRQADRLDALSVDGTEVLELTEIIDGEAYVTLVYCHGGYLRELFTPASSVCLLNAGECILPAQAVSFALEDGLLTADITAADGETVQISVYVRSGGGGL